MNPVIEKAKKILILFGGESSEHEVSIMSAKNVHAAAKSLDKYEISLCYIDKGGRWYFVQDFENDDRTNEIVPVMGESKFKVLGQEKYLEPDVILPILHGENAEDGTIQGLARLMHIPIVGCKVDASVICFDKVITKQLLEHSGIKTVPYFEYIKGMEIPKIESLGLGEDLFIKPSRCGSSVGTGMASNNEELEIALLNALKYDEKVLIEKKLKVRELEVGILDDRNEVKASVVGEILPDRAFYDYDSKYSDDSSSKVAIPADIDDELSNKIRETGIKAFNILNCSDLSRVDFFLTDEGELFLNEVNTLPGFTNISMYPKLWEHQGVSYPELIDRLISKNL